MASGANGSPDQSGREDMFANVRGDISEGNLFGPAMWAILCGVCCGCVFVGLVIAFYVWAIITLINTAPSNQTECGKAHLMWEYCVTLVVVMPILGLAINVIAAAIKIAALLAIPSLISSGLIIWGFVLWAYLGECEHFYNQSYPDLFLLFKIYVIFFIVALCLACCIMCCVLCLFGMAGVDAVRGPSSNNGYSSVPGNPSTDESLRTRAGEGDRDEVERLLQREGADVKSRDPSTGWTALHHAAHYGHRNVAELLVASGANVDAETYDRRTALQMARDQGHEGVAQFLEHIGAFSGTGGGVGRQSATMEFV